MANYTSVTASNICDAAGNKLASGTVSFQATDASNQPIPFQVGGGGQVVTTPAVFTITNGAIAGGAQVADSANTTPAGILYRIVITDTTLNRVVATYSLVTVTGGTFNLDNYSQTGAAVLPPTGGSINGPLTVLGNLSVTGSLGTISTSVLNGVRVVDGVRFTSIQAAINDLPSCVLNNDLNSYTNPPSTYNSYTFNHCGEVYIPAGTYTVSSEIDITSPYVKVRGAGPGATVINWTGTTGCAFSWTTSPFVDDWVGSGGLHDLRIDGFNGAAGTCGVKDWDNTGFHMKNVVIANFSGAGSVGWWQYNASAWNEKHDVQITLKNNTVGWLGQRGPGSNGATLGYGRFEVTCDVFSGQTCMKIDGGSNNAVELSHSILHITANLVSNPANATAIQTVNGAVVYDNIVQVHIEAPFGMGTGHQFNLGANTQFIGVGPVHQDFPSSNLFGSGSVWGITQSSGNTWGFANGVPMLWNDASGVPRNFALKDASNNQYFYGDATGQQIIFQPVPGTTLLTLSSAGATLPQGKTLAFGVAVGNQPLILGDGANPAHLQIRGGNGGGQFWNNSFLSTITTWDDSGNWVFSGQIQIGSVTFASLGTPSNGTLRYCSDCTVANPCASGGTGALAKRINGAWVCN